MATGLFRTAGSFRLIVAMWRLYAGIETDFGRAVIDILKKQYPDQDVSEHPGTVGNKLMAIARKQLQNNESDAMDSIQELLTYLTTGSKFEQGEDGRVERKTAKPWDFAKDFKTWQEALRAIYSNLRTNAMGRSVSKSKKKKRERSVDDAFGVRGEGGGDPDGGEGRMPTDPESGLGKALDDKAAVKSFLDVIDDHVADLRSFLSEDSRKLFDLIFDDEVGSFSSDIKENMGQASALKEKHPDLFEKNAKRWSGFVGDLRKKLLADIWNYIETEMSNKDFARLREQFFSDADPSAVRKIEREKVKGKEDYQKGLDERKLSRLKSKKDSEGLSPQEQKDFDRLSKRLSEQGVDVDSVPAGKAASSIDSMSISLAGHVASSKTVLFWESRPWMAS